MDELQILVCRLLSLSSIVSPEKACHFIFAVQNFRKPLLFIFLMRGFSSFEMAACRECLTLNVSSGGCGCPKP